MASHHSELGRIRSFYDREAERYYNERYIGSSADAEVWRDRSDMVLRLAGPSPGRVLEIGCGPGILTDSLSRQASRLVSVDVSAGMLMQLRAGHDGASVAAADFAALPVANAAFDTVIAIGVWGFSSRPGQCLREAARALTPGGRLILQAANRHSWRVRLEAAGSRLLHGPAYEGRLATNGICPARYSRREVIRCLRHAGFGRIDVRPYDFRLPWLGQVSTALDRASEKAAALILGPYPITADHGAEGMVFCAELSR